ncbi:MAG: hypothetical protein HUJ56_01960, partial [Erysipelotrichaceae bacterium]|nr:hypothetical protein [Erysipelotrichaceae bacterium]
NPNYTQEATATATLTINKRPVTFTGETNTKVYTGSDIELTGVSDNYSEDDKTGLVSGHTSNVAYSAKGKEVSATAYPGTITDKTDVVIMNGAADVTDNYDITVDPGSLTIIQSDAEWTIGLEDSEFTYDTGAHHITSTPESHAASGTTTYEYSFNENSGYVSDLTSLEKTDVEEYTVYVRAKNPNYSTTAKTTAKLKIKQKDVKVTITGHTVTQTYNNTTYTAEGYDFNADYNKYQQGYVNFSATASVSRKYAGKAMMGLADTQFTNTNANYNVTFEVIDGYVEINPVQDKVTVTIIGDTVSKTYDGTTYTANGYAFSSDNSLYQEIYVDFNGSATVSGKDVNKSMMNLDATQFANNSDNFADVEFVVTDGYVEITKRKVTITVTNSNKTFGEVDPAFEGQISNLVKGESIVGLTYVRTNTGIEVVGEYTNVLSATYGDNPNYDIEVIPANFEIVQAGSLRVNGTNYYSTYDGNVHGTPAIVNVTEGTTITYSIDGGKSWSDTVPTIKDVGVVNVTVKATHHDYAEHTNTYKLEVIPLPIVVDISGTTDSREYDGELHEVNGYTWLASNDLDLYKENDFEFNGSAHASQKDKGKTFMNLDKDDFTNKNGNFDVTFNIASDGYQEIKAKTGVVVTITGHTQENTYDSYNHEITGYDFEPNTTLYTTNDYNFSGVAKAERKDFGQTQMNLSAAQFTNTSDNFENVAFNVTDGYQKINKVTDKVTVTITGHTTSKTYDGTTYMASGYDFEANNALYKENDVVFVGSAYAAQKGVETAYMGLSSGQFSNKSANFAEVEFVVTDGYVEITKRPVIITVANNTKVFGTTDPVITGDVTNLVDGDPIVNLAYVRENTDEVVGIYEKVLSATYDEHPNYAISVIKGKFEITKANTLTVSGTNYSQAYDGSEHGLAAKANVEEGTTYKYSIDNGTSWVSEVPTIKDVGKLEVKVIAEHHDYESAENNYTLEVLPKAVKVTVKDATKVYGDEDPEKFESEVDGLIGEDEVTYTIKRGNGEKVDDYPITATGDEFQGNYQVSYEDGEFKITPRVIEFEWDEVDYTYDGTEKEVTATISNLVSWNGVEDDVTVDTYDENKVTDAGEYIAKVVAITGKDSDNYKLDKVTYEWMIKRAKPVIKAKDNIFDYDGKPHTAEAELTLGDGVLKSENATQTNSGTYPVTFSVDQTKNFEALKVDAKLTILPRKVEDGGIEITDFEDIVIDGGEVVFPEVIVRDTKTNEVLVRDKDYRATFDNDRTPGEHELVVDFMGNYGGKFRKKYRILPANVDPVVEEAVIEEYPSIKQEVDVLEETIDEEEKVETGIWVEEKVSEIVEAIPVEIYSDDPGDTWAIIDLLIMVVMASLTIMLVLSDDKSQEEDEEKKKRIEYYRKAMKAASVIITLLAIITFYFTEDMSNTATLIGVYTIYYVLAFIAQIFINIFGVNREDDGSNHHFA